MAHYFIIVTILAYFLLGFSFAPPLNHCGKHHACVELFKFNTFSSLCAAIASFSTVA